MEIPSSFRTLAERGHFDYWGGRKHRDLSAAERTQLAAERRGSVLWLRGIEWGEIPTHIEERSDLVPGVWVFAGSGGGGSYAFLPAWQKDAPEPPVLFVARDEPASFFAPTFATMLYRLWLQQASDWSDEYDGPDREAALRAWAAIIAPHLEERYPIAALAADLDRGALAAALEAFVATLPDEPFVATLPPTRFNPKFVKGERAARLYAESIATYRALVEAGHTRFQSVLEETEKNRDAALK